MARPRTLKRIIQDLLDEPGSDYATIAEEIGAAPNRLRRLILRPDLAAVTEEKALRDLHRYRFPEVYEVEAEKKEQCPTNSTPKPTSPPDSEPSPATTPDADSTGGDL